MKSTDKIAVGKFLLVNPSDVLGAEIEGGAGTFADHAATVPVYLIGPGTPRTGDYLVCRFVDHRWVTEVGGGTSSGASGVLLPSCFCLVPSTIQMTSADPRCNYKMFQSCTLTYGPPPPAMVAFGYKTNVFTSGTFTDPLTDSDFFYHFWCQYNQFFLTRIYPTSPYGSPFRDGILYSWAIGGANNTCDPFQLLSGSPFPESDPSCSVTITG